MERFRAATSENFIRAFNLVKNIERSAEINGTFEKENIVNVHIIEHLVDYIKKMSMSFNDLNEEFSKVNNELDSEFFSTSDPFIKELQNIFCDLLIENYFINIFAKLEHSLHSLSMIESGNEILNVQKFYFFYYILYKMNDVFISFLNSNISYLISPTINKTIESKMEGFMNQFYACFFSRIGQEIKILLVNKDDFSYL